MPATESGILLCHPQGQAFYSKHRSYFLIRIATKGHLALISSTNDMINAPACSTLGFNIGNLDKLAKLAILPCMKGRPSMSMLTFRNRRGALVDIPTVKATQVKNEFGSILEKATRSGAVAITRHATPKAVLLSYEEFESLVQVQSRTLENLGAEFDDLLDRMQTPKAKKGMESAFHASPAKLGRAAMRAARKGRKY
jgi:antitoxin Phd